MYHCELFQFTIFIKLIYRNELLWASFKFRFYFLGISQKWCVSSTNQFFSRNHFCYSLKMQCLELPSRNTRVNFQLSITFCYWAKKFCFDYSEIKGAPSGLRQFLANENPLKMVKNTFYFTLKALFVLSFCLDFLVM